MTTPTELRRLLRQALPALAAHEDRLRDLDAALGDGDLGITVRSGCTAIVESLDALPSEAGIDEILRAAGKAFATANPSTFAALIGGGLLAAAKVVPSTDALDRVGAGAIVRAVTDRIVERGKAQLGDKTILDALVPTLAILDADDDSSSAEVVGTMRDLAHERVEETAALKSVRGRAAWVGERGVGHPDPGATAYALLLDELATAMGARS